MDFLFSDRAFNAFMQDTVEDVMHEFRRYVQPLLRKYGNTMRDIVGKELKVDNIPMHVAKHIRRKVTVPFNTWVAIGGDQRGYKKYAHLQLGINGEYVFLVLALIDHPTYEQEIVATWEKNLELFTQLPEDTVFIYDHTQLPFDPLSHLNLVSIFHRSRNKNKADIMIGRILMKNDPVLLDGKKFESWLKETVSSLCPLFALAYQTEHRIIKNDVNMKKG